jgi:integrase
MDTTTTEAKTRTPKTGGVLTDKSIAAAARRPPSKGNRELFDGNGSGLAARVSFAGTVSFVLNYRWHGQTCRFVLGKHPALTLKEARKRARAAQVGLAADPPVDPRTGKRERRSEKLFSEAVTAYVAAISAPLDRGGRKSWPETKRVLTKVFVSRWRHRPIASITRADIRDVVDAIAIAHPVAANRAIAALSALFSFGLERGWIVGTPMARFKKSPERKRTRTLNDDELRELWAALEVAPNDNRNDDEPVVAPMIARGLQTILLTAQRPGEVFGMTKNEIVRDANGTATWVIPKARLKVGHHANAQDHHVPLTATALRIVDEAIAAGTDADNPYVFAGTHRASVGQRSKRVMAAMRKRNVITFDAGRHDLRRTSATLMEAAGVRPYVISKVIGHMTNAEVSAVDLVYMRHHYVDEKRAALEVLERKVAAIVAENDAKRVLTFSR